VTHRLALRRGFNQHITWSRPDSPQPSICSICFGALPEVPLMIWKSSGACAAFCDHCVETWFEVTAA